MSVVAFALHVRMLWRDHETVGTEEYWKGFLTHATAGEE